MRTERELSPEDEAMFDAQAVEQDEADFIARQSDDFWDDEAFTEIEVMLAAWRTGTPAARDVALQLADGNRKRATPNASKDNRHE